MPCPTWRPSTRRLGLNLLLSYPNAIFSLVHISGPSLSSHLGLWSAWALLISTGSTKGKTFDPPYTWNFALPMYSSSISHSSGLGQQPGFISSAKFLLPWEVIFSKKEVCRKCLFAFQVPLSKATRPQLEAKWPSILENHAKRASLRSPDEPAEDKITVKVVIWFNCVYLI